MDCDLPPSGVFAMNVEFLLQTEPTAVVELLKKKKRKLVLAESCTGGSLAALLTEVPGSSSVFCGSHVVYQEASKTKWLGVSPSLLKKHTAVSAACAEAMVRGALKKTPHADIAASVTGYLGPEGDPVGRVFISVLERGSKKAVTVELDIEPLLTQNIRRSPRKRRRFSDTEKRLFRRELTAISTLFLVRSSLEI
jgi:nicotinamide-nucleotide amidase